MLCLKPALVRYWPLVAALLSPLPIAAESVLPYTLPTVTPEVGSGYSDKPGWVYQQFAVAAANPLATDAGYQVLAAGGSAVDAAIAVQMVLTLVEPQSSGIGGGAFLLYYDGQAIGAYDGRETAPQAVGGSLFLDAEGEPLAFLDAAASGLSVGVPGTVRMLELAHRDHGRLPWADLFTPAIRLAEHGFPVSHRLHTSLAAEQRLRDDPLARAFYYDSDGSALAVGHMLHNPALAAILSAIAADGSAALHTGAIAEDLIARVQSHHSRPGAMTLDDLADYQAQPRDPLCTDWRAYSVCGFPPPSSGHLTLMQILGMLDQLELPEPALENQLPRVAWLHAFLEAARLAFADRGQYIADPDFVSAPADDWTSLLDPDYLARRAELIGNTSMGSGAAVPGNPGAITHTWGLQATQPEYGTSHISIVDAHGHAVAMTTTIEAAFGARILADGGTGLPGGYLLNNELTDFSFRPQTAEGLAIANRGEPGKRPRSSMSPTLVFDRDSGELLASLGSPGGAAIIHYVARTLIALFDWGLDAQKALELPHAITLGGTVFVEQGRFPERTLSALRELGHATQERELTSGLQAIQRTDEGWFGGAAPRREGVVMGQ